MQPEDSELVEVPEEVPQEVYDEAMATPEMKFSWEASEYVHHHKSPMWYGVLASGVVALILVAIMLHFWLEIALFAVMGVAVSVYASKPPRSLKYELSDEGIHIDSRLYPFTVFRSFNVIDETEWHSIDLEPAKRFSPRMVVLFDADDFDEIVGHLELHLPREDRDPDMIERISRYVRF